QRKDQERARQGCLDRMVTDMVKVGGHRLVLDSRQESDRHDEGTIRAVLGTRPRETGLTYEHVDSRHELLLGGADVVGWGYGAGGDWRRRVAPVIAELCDLDQRGTARSPAADRPDGEPGSLSPPTGR